MLNYKHLMNARLVLRENIVSKILKYLKYYCTYKFANFIINKEFTITIDVNEQYNIWNLWGYQGNNANKYSLNDFIIECFDNITPQYLHHTTQRMSNESEIQQHISMEVKKMSNCQLLIHNLITNINN